MVAIYVYYILAVPLFGLSFALNFVNFDVIWRYFGWANSPSWNRKQTSRQ